MNKKLIEKSFSSVFNDNEWFNKVLIGGLYIFLVFFGIGIVMINGFLVEFIRSLSAGNKNMPYWRNSSHIIRTGWKVSLALVLYYGIVTFGIFLSGIPIVSLETAATYFILLTTIHPLALLAYARKENFSTCFNWKFILEPLVVAGSEIMFAAVVSAVLLFLAVTLGWMWIVAGWTLLVFLALLIQNAMFALAAKNYFSNHS